MGKEKMGCATCCKLEAIVSVDERGQMILPKELRDKAQIKTGDKLVFASCEEDEKVRCFFVMKADELKGSLKEAFGPLLEDLLR